MKKLFFIVALLGSMAALAEDSYLYWMVSPSSMSDNDYLKVRLANSDTYLTLYNEGFAELSHDSTVASKADVVEADAWGEGFYAGFNGSSLPADFIIELYNEGGQFLGQSALYAVASDSQYIYRGGMGLPTAAAVAISTFAIPEPSSGLLMLVGCAMLGLRRRKVKTA